MNINHLLLGCLRQNLWCIFMKYDFKDVCQTFLKPHITLSIISEYYCSLLFSFSKVTNCWKWEVLKGFETSVSHQRIRCVTRVIILTPMSEAGRYVRSLTTGGLCGIYLVICVRETADQRLHPLPPSLTASKVTSDVSSWICYDLSSKNTHSTMKKKTFVWSSHDQRAVVVLQSGIEVDG